MISDQDWEEYKEKFNKIYSSDQEEQMRRKLYSKVKMAIDEHNKRYEANEVTYSLDVNKYSDYTEKELSKVDWNVCKGFQGRLHRDIEEPELPEIF